MRNVIIGSGVYGLSTAIELVDKGMDVSIIDSNNDDIASKNALGRLDPIFKGSGSSVKLENNNSTQRPKDQRNLALKSFNLHIDYYEKYYNGTPYEYEFKNIPTLQILNKNDVRVLKNEFEEINKNGFKVSILGSNEEIKNHVPNISKYINNAAIVEGTRFIDAKSFIYSLKRRLIDLGGNYIQNKAEKINIEKKEITLSDSSKYDYDKLIICAGPWTNELLSTLNKKIDMYPAKGEIIKIEKLSSRLNYHLHGSCSIVERSDGLIWIAATHNEYEFNSEKTKKAEKELIKKASEIIPEISELKKIDHTACVRPSTKNGMPIVTEVIDSSDVYVATGGGGWGIMQCFYIGKLVLDLIK
tara:strand:+ start:1081 stop:2154 length:1074 start_codon:yes stop_codon:yes gene_type:complete